jgi:hypothetical protein
LSKDAERFQPNSPLTTRHSPNCPLSQSACSEADT